MDVHVPKAKVTLESKMNDAIRFAYDAFLDRVRELGLNVAAGASFEQPPHDFQQACLKILGYTER